MGDEDRSVLGRFGNRRAWTLPDGIPLNIGEAVASAGPGGGFAIIPWALDTYERVLRLQPEDTWLLKRMLKHAWAANTPVYLSLRKIEREALISRARLRAILERLEGLGYIVRLPPEPGDNRRRRYSVAGLYDALALCVAQDPSSTWAREHGTLIPEPETRYTNGHGVHYRLDVAARRNGHRDTVYSTTIR